MVIASAIGTAAFISCDAIAERVSVVGPLEAGAAAVLAILLLRWRFNRWLLARRSASKFLRTVVMVGTNEDAEALWRLLSDEPELGYRVGGVAGEPQKSAPWEGLPDLHTDRAARRAGQAGGCQRRHHRSQFTGR